jgi:tetratricopeptide (TPR) repeat protein
MIKMKPDFTDAYYNLAMILSAEGQLANAEECFRKAAEYDENCHRAYYQLARIHAANREYGRCLDNLKKAVSLSKEYINRALNEKIFDSVRNLNGYKNIIEN